MTDRQWDPNEFFEKADQEYREAERVGRLSQAIQHPIIMTIMFTDPSAAHEVVDSIKEHGGIVTQAAGMHTQTAPCNIIDIRRLGETHMAPDASQWILNKEGQEDAPR